MQAIGLPRHVTRGAALAPHRRDVPARWRPARDKGLTAAEAAEAVGVSRAPLYRWRTRAGPRSRRPRRVRRPDWTPALVAAVKDLHQDCPMWGKARIALLLQRRGYRVGESTTGRILKSLMERGAVAPAPLLRRNGPRAARRVRPCAGRLPKGRKPTSPGEIAQRDTLTISPRPGRPAIKPFTARAPAARRTCAQAWRRATAHNARRFPDKLQDHMPFPIEAIQVDGGSGFKADFETERQRRSIALFELPPRSPRLNGPVERNNGAGRYESCAIWDLPNDDLDDINQWLDACAEQFNTFRPYQALGGQTPAKYLANRTAKKTSRLMCPEPGQDVDNAGGARL